MLENSKKLVMYTGEALRLIPVDTAGFATEFAHYKVVCVRVEKFAAPRFGGRENAFKCALNFRAHRPTSNEIGFNTDKRRRYELLTDRRLLALKYFLAKSALQRSCPCWDRMYAECATVRRTKLAGGHREWTCAQSSAFVPFVDMLG